MRMKLPFKWPRGGRARVAPKGFPRLAVMGAMRSGTNLVRRLVEAHWEVSAEFSPYGWKHAGVPIFSPDSGYSYPDVPVLFVVKNPYASMLSLFRYRLLALTKGHRISIEGGETLQKFLDEPVTLFDSQLKGSPKLRFSNPVQYWNFIYSNLETLDPAAFDARGINYEDLLADPETLSIVEELGNLRRRPGPILLPGEATQRETDSSSGSRKVATGTFHIAYYRDHQYLDELTAAQVAFISSQVDRTLMQSRGYQVF
jgi:hypothetical protein